MPLTPTPLPASLPSFAVCKRPTSPRKKPPLIPPTHPPLECDEPEIAVDGFEEEFDEAEEEEYDESEVVSHRMLKQTVKCKSKCRPLGKGRKNQQQCVSVCIKDAKCKSKCKQWKRNGDPNRKQCIAVW